MKSKKIIALLLAACMCLPILASCTDHGDGGDHTRPPSSGSSNDNFPSADYNKEDFTFLFIKHSELGTDYYGGDYLDSESLTGKTLEDAVYERNLAVEEKYNVKIGQRFEYGDPATVLKDYIYAGEYNYDVIYGWCYKLGAAIVENYFADFYELRDNGTIDLEAEYWSPSSVDDLTIAGKLYLCPNDISMNKLNWADTLFFNKQIVEDLRVDEHLGTTLYELVDSGKWTYDKYLDLLTYASVEVDGLPGISKDDIFGLVDGSANGSSLLAGCGVDSVKKNDDGSLTLDIYNEKVLGIMDKVAEVYHNSSYVKSYKELWENADWSSFTDEWEYARSFFSSDHALFCGGSPYMTGEFRNMKSEYGILPYPKYDENQENYVASCSSLASIFALPSTVRTDMSTASMERTGTILEYMAYKSNQLLLPAYYDTLLKGQRLNSPDDSRMLDVIRNSVRYNIADAVGITDVSELVSNMCQTPSAATSTYNRNSRKVQKELDSFYMEVINLESKKADK